MPDLLFFLLAGHFCGDYALQSDHVARHKPSSAIILTAHVFIYTLTVTTALIIGLTLNGYGAVWSSITVYIALVVFATHWVQDYIKSAKFNAGKQAQYVDQAIHVLILFIIRIVVYGSQ